MCLSFDCSRSYVSKLSLHFLIFIFIFHLDMIIYFNKTQLKSSSLRVIIFFFVQQMKVVERYQKRLEFHLSQVEDLLDQYHLHQKLREGVSEKIEKFHLLIFNFLIFFSFYFPLVAITVTY